MKRLPFSRHGRESPQQSISSSAVANFEAEQVDEKMTMFAYR
jgi:hypothetical protein